VVVGGFAVLVVRAKATEKASPVADNALGVAVVATTALAKR